uniref:Phosphoribulokinase/uridine kinase domain-containing protein n=1 Tax=Brassica campestris TaxID=3711 RepID=M4CV71_BRACM
MSSSSPTIKETKETIYYGEVYDAQVKKKKNEKEPSKKKEQREKSKKKVAMEVNQEENSQVTNLALRAEIKDRKRNLFLDEFGCDISTGRCDGVHQKTLRQSRRDFAMVLESSVALSPRRRLGLLRDQVQLIKRKDSGRYEIVPIEDSLSFEKGFYAVIRACQLLAQKNDGLILVGLAGPSGAGKTVFTEKILNFMPSIAIINMDNYNDGTRVIDGNFDDPRLTDYDTLLDNLHGLKDGKSVQVPIYDFKSSSRIGYRTLEVPSSRIVILEGIYALSEKLRPFLDLRVSVTGGVHFDLVKRVLRDIQRAGQEPEEIIHQISETVYPMYKAFIEPDLKTAHIKIQNKFNPFSGFQNPTYILKSTKAVTPEQMKAVLSEDFKERTEETYDIYLLPPGEDPEACKDVRLLGGLMALGYTIATILKRKSHIFDDEKVIVKTDWLEQLNRTYVQVQGRDRSFVENVANELGLEGSYCPHTYIEQIQLERLVNDVMALPDDLKTKLSLDDDTVSSPKEALSRASADSRMKYLHGGVSKSYTNQRHKVLPNLTRLAVNNRMLDARAPASPATLPNQGVITQLSDQISTLNERMDDFTSRIEELNSKIPNRIAASGSQHNLALPMENGNGSLLSLSSSQSQLVRESPLMEEVILVARGQRQIMHQMDTLSNLLREYVGERSRIERLDSNRTNSTTQNLEASTLPVLLALVVGCLGVFAYSRLK